MFSLQGASIIQEIIGYKRQSNRLIILIMSGKSSKNFRMEKFVS
jgi:hypothetical protein